MTFRVTRSRGLCKRRKSNTCASHSSTRQASASLHTTIHSRHASTKLRGSGIVHILFHSLWETQFLAEGLWYHICILPHSKPFIFANCQPICINNFPRVLSGFTCFSHSKTRLWKRQIFPALFFRILRICFMPFINLCKSSNSSQTSCWLLSVDATFTAHRLISNIWCTKS